VPRSRRTALLRGGGFLLAAGLGVVGIWLIVTGTDSKHVRIGAICAFWGLLLGTYAMFGARLPARAPEPSPAAPQAPPPSRELDLRQLGEIERSAVAAARREFQQELQLMLRREVHDGFAREVASLRAEVNALRSDLVEKVGGQLRLERIETTRLIGSDLEAVQSELRKLRETAVEAEPPQVHLAATQEIHEAEIVLDRIETVAKPATEPVTTVKAALPQEVVVPPPVVPRPVQQPSVQQAAPPAQPQQSDQPQPDGADPFAGMPRITPFTDFALDAAPPAADRGAHSRSSRHRAEEGGHDVLARILSREQG
jgi:hypothetical protein